MKEAIELLEMAERCIKPPSSFCEKAHGFLIQALAILQQPKASSEFTERIRKFVKMYENEIPRRAEISFLEEALKIIDTSEASRKELLDNLKMLVALLCHPGSFVSAKDIEKAKVAISNAKKVETK